MLMPTGSALTVQLLDNRSLKAKVVGIFKEYNQILKKAGGVYTQG